MKHDSEDRLLNMQPLLRIYTIYKTRRHKNAYEYKAIAMMRRKSPRSENIYLIENHFQANISK